MLGYATAYLTGSPWLGVLAGGFAGVLLGAMHGLLCSLKRVNDIAIGIAMMTLGTGLAFFFGKPFIQPAGAALAVDSRSPTGPAIRPWRRRSKSIRSSSSASRRRSRWPGHFAIPGSASSSARPATARPAALAMGIPVDLVRTLVDRRLGGFLAGVGGSFLSLYYPGSWNEGLSSGSGPDGGGARDLRPLEPRSAACWPRCCSARPARSGRRCSRSASPTAITCSTPPPTS